MAKNIHIIIILIFQKVVFCTVAEMLSLPLDKSEAEYMIETGELDSLRWEELEPYYIDKISVPHGEIFMLKDIAPQLSGDLPVRIEILKKYAPWNEKKIELFFEDYPNLKLYKPILDFNYARLNQSGKIGFSCYQSNVSSKMQQSAQILLNPFSQIKFQARINFTTEFARWHRRLLFLNPVDWIAIEIGNFNSFNDMGLIYGYFPYHDNRSVNDNWLYGKISSWNGVNFAIEKNWVPLQVKTNIFYHKRLTETASGFDLKIGLSKKVWLESGLSRLSTDSTFGTHVYIFCGSGISFSNFSSKIIAVSGLSNPEAVSLKSENKISIDRQKINIDITYLPEGYFAPRSGLIKSDLGKDVCSNPLSGSLVIVGMESQYKISRYFFCLGFKADIYNQILHDISSSLKFRLTDFKIGYKWKKYGFGIDSINHYFNCAYRFNINRYIGIETEHRFTKRYKKPLYYYYGTIGTELTFLAHLNINPFFRIVTNRLRNFEKRVGIRQVFTPFERIYTEFVYEQSELVSSGKRRDYAEVKAWFLF